jgi:integrase
MKRPYLLQKRGAVWYYRLAGQSTFHTTGERSQGEAITFAIKKIGHHAGGPAPKLKDFASTFFVWGECEWIKRQLARDKHISRASAENRRAHLLNFILPQFGEKRLTDIRRLDVENWLLALPVANGTKNAILYSFRLVMATAEEAEHIEYNTLEKIKPLGANPKTRDVLSLPQLSQLFPDDMAALLHIWGGIEKAAYFMTLATSGIRLSEARALLWRHFLRGQALLIERAVKRHNEVGGTKNRDIRVVLLFSKTASLIETWREKCPWIEPDDLIFPGENRGHFLNPGGLRYSFSTALQRAGITHEGKNIVIHSLRHSFNTHLREVLPDQMLKMLTGHKSSAMVEHYDHPSVDDRLNRLLPAKEVVERIFTFSPASSPLPRAGE